MSSKRIAVIGGGPMGLEAALYGCALGHQVHLYERNLVGANIARWGFVELFTPWKMNTTPLGCAMLGREEWCAGGSAADACVTGNQFRQEYLLPLTQTPLMEGVVQDQNRVVSVEHSAAIFNLTVHDSSGKTATRQADVVLDCTGTYGNHRWAGRNGVPAVGERDLESRLWYTIPDLLGRDHDRFAGKTSLLVGCGLSAVTALSQFEQLVARVPQTKVVWAIRRPGQGLEVVLADPFPKRRKLVKGAMGMLKSPPPWLNFMGLRMMDSVSANGRFSVSLGGEEDSVNVSVDEVVTLVGYMPDNSIYGSWLNRPAEAPVVESGQEPSINPESGLFFLGARSYGVNSNFLMQTGHNQIRQAFKIIEGNPTLDLHQ